MRLGYYFHVPAILKEGKIYTPGYQAVFIDSLAQYCEKIICFLHFPRTDEIDQCNSVIRSENVELVNIGFHSSVPRRLIYSRRYTSHLIERRSDLDAILLRGPSPLLPGMAHAAGDLPVTLLLVSDYLAGVNDLPQPRWRKEADRAFSWWNTQQQLRIAKRSLTIVNSHKLYQQLENLVPNLVETQTTTLNESDFYLRNDTCQGRPLHILYTGRMASSKGLMDILQAVIELTHKGEDLVLDLVGIVDKNDPVLEKIKVQAAEAGIADRVFYHGYHRVGSDLFQFYKMADIFVLASRSSHEGFPRTIWEAFSQGVPVIATSVGSIPDYLRNGIDALIVAPKSPLELAEKIKRLISETDLRQKLIANGYLMAEGNTLDRRAKEMITEIERWVEKLK